MKTLPLLLALLIIIPTIGFSQDPCGDLDLLSVNDTSICNGQSILISAIAGYDNYSWSTGSENQYTSISIPGTYTISSTYTTNNLVTNGNFSLGNTGFSSSYNYSATNLYPEGVYSVTTNANTVHNGFTGSGGGNFMVVNGSTSPGMEVWCQDIVVEPGTMYNFSSLVTTVANGNPALLQFSINSSVIGTTFSAPNTTGSWTDFNATWSSNTETTAEICIVNQNVAGGGNDFGLDDITFTTLCTSSEAINVTEEESANATIFSVNDLCESGTSVNLNAVDPGGIWSGNGITNSSTGLFNPNLAGEGIHTITYTIEGSCGAESTTDINVVEETESSIMSPESICQNESPINLEGIPGIGVWEGNGITNTSNGLFNPQEAQIGLNTINYMPNGFCMEVSSSQIEVYEVLSPEADLYHQICFGDIVNLNTGETLFSEYNWSTGESTSNINITSDGIYTLSLLDFNDCSQELQFVIIDQENCENIVMPNVFTPNNDYENDLFIPILYEHIPSSILRIYNRWGVEVFHSQFILDGWNGKHFSKDCPEGVYYWVIEYQTNKEEHYKLTGFVNLLR